MAELPRGRVLAFFENLPRCLVGKEACSTSHYWARELTARGHDVRLVPAQYLKPYLKRQKRCCRCRGDLRGGDPADHALRADSMPSSVIRIGRTFDSPDPDGPKIETFSPRCEIELIEPSQIAETLHNFDELYDRAGHFKGFPVWEGSSREGGCPPTRPAS